jgi:predicted transcriptional regulator
MGRNKRETTAIAHRRQAVADLYLQGWTQTAIAKQLGAAQSTVSADLKAIEAQWRESAVRDFDIVRGVELRKLERIEREAWEAWERTKKPAQSAVMTTDGEQQKTQKTVKEQHGDPRFLEAIQRCIASRRALLGLDAPVRVAPTSPDGEQAYHLYVMAELMKLAEQSKSGPEVVDAAFITRQLELEKGQDHVRIETDESDAR